MEETISEYSVEILNAAELTLDSPWVIASCIINALLLVVTLLSVVCAYRSVKTAYDNYLLQKKRGQKESACDLAKVFAQDIIPEFSFICNVLSASKLESYLRGLVNLEEIQNFDRKELESFLEKKETTLEEVHKKIGDIPASAIVHARLITSNSLEERNSYWEAFTKSASADNELSSANSALIRNEFYGSVTNLLNNLEWFAMNCRYGIADEEILYQSLHKMYISTIWSLYFFISSANTSGCDKLYTNVIWLFLKWQHRYSEIKDCAEAKRKRAQEQLAKATEIYENIDSSVYTGTPL